MSKQREALHIALEALEQYGTSSLNNEDAYSAAIKTIREALAEPEQEPTTDGELYAAFLMGLHSKNPTRKPLTDEQISAIVQSMSAYTWDAHMLARAIERAHGIGVKHE